MNQDKDINAEANEEEDGGLSAEDECQEGDKDSTEDKEEIKEVEDLTSSQLASNKESFVT